MMRKTFLPQLDERGFMLVETTVLAFFVITAAAAVAFFALGARRTADGRARIAANFLALEQLAYIEAMPAASRSGSLAWRGEASSLSQNGVSYRVTATVSNGSYGTQSAAVSVRWTADGHSQSLNLKRVLADSVER